MVNFGKKKFAKESFLLIKNQSFFEYNIIFYEHKPSLMIVINVFIICPILHNYYMWVHIYVLYNIFDVCRMHCILFIYI
jgi:hypothetical protein